MKMRGLLLVSLMLSLLISCDDTASPEKDEDFILAVMVMDTGGQPKAGMTVARLNSLEGTSTIISNSAIPDPVDTLRFSYPNPFFGSTTVEYSTVDIKDVLLEVLDWRERHVATVEYGRDKPGFHSVEWDGMETGGERAMNGVYVFRLTLTDTLDVPEYSWEGTVDCTIFDLRDKYRHGIGVTNATGFFSTRNLDFFPSLQGHEVQDAYDEARRYLGTVSFSDTVSIRVSTPSPEGGGWIYHMSRKIVLVDGPNYLEFYFVPDDSTGVFGEDR